MRTILSFQLPAVPGISRENVIASMCRWVTQSPHYDLKDPLSDLPSGENFTRYSADFYGRAAAFQMVQYGEKDHRYIAAQLERPDENNNLLWRAQCVFEQEGETGGIFFILLERGVLHPEMIADLQVIPSVPFIAKRLFLDGLALRPSEIAGDRKDDYPQIQAGQLSPFKTDIMKIFSSVARVSEQSGPEADNKVRVIYPKADVDRIYSEDGFGQSADQATAQLVSDVFSMIAEVHSGPTISFDALWHLASDGERDAPRPLSPGGSYCYMNQDMADLLKTARKERGLSQKELAQQVGTSGLILSRLETLRVQRVLRSMLNDVERELGLPHNAIVSLQSKTLPPASMQPALNLAEEKPPQRAGYCRQCGTHLYADSHFCPVCGTKVLPT